jgi:hypothetical protein
MLAGSVGGTAFTYLLFVVFGFTLFPLRVVQKAAVRVLESVLVRGAWLRVSDWVLESESGERGFQVGSGCRTVWGLQNLKCVIVTKKIVCKEGGEVCRGGERACSVCAGFQECSEQSRLENLGRPNPPSLSLKCKAQEDEEQVTAAVERTWHMQARL